MPIKSKPSKRKQPARTANPSSVHAVTGELTIAVAAELKSRVATWLSDARVITLDLSGVNRVDCAGLQVVVAASRTGRVTLRSMSSAVHRAMETIGYRPVDWAPDS